MPITDPQTIISANQDPALAIYTTDLQDIPPVANATIYVTQQVDRSSNYVTIDEATATGATGAVQYNVNGRIAGDSSFVYNPSSKFLTVSTGLQTYAVYTNKLYYANGTAWDFSNGGSGGPFGNADVANYLPSYTGNLGGTILDSSQTNITELGTLVSLTVDGLVSLNDVSNVSITGGSTGQVLTTDGSGVLTWEDSPSAVAAGATTQIQYNQGGSFAGDANLTYNSASRLLSASYVAGTLTTALQPNVTSVGTLTGLGISGYVTGNLSPADTSTYNLGSASKKWYDVHVGNSVIIGTQTISATPGNVIFNTTLTNDAYVSGTLNAEVVRATTIYGNLVGTISTAGTVTASAQPNIRSVGNLTSLNVTNNLVVSTGTITGNASGLYSIPATGLVGVAPYANVAYNVSGANVSGTVANATIAVTAGTVTTAAQPNVTSVGTLTGLTVNGVTTLGSVSNVRITGGTSGYVLSTNGSGTLSWIEQAGGGGTVAGNSTQLQFNDSGEFGASANLTFDNTTNELSIVGNIANVNYATANYFVGTVLGDVVGTASAAGNVTVADQPLITSLGSLTSLYVEGTTGLGNVGNVTILGGTNGQVLTTNGSGGLSWTTVSGGGGSSGSNITNGTSNVDIATSGGNITAAVGGTSVLNITSSGLIVTGNVTATGLTSTGIVNLSETSNVSLGSNANVHITGGTTGQVLTTDGSGALSWTTVSGGGASGSNITNGTSNVDIASSGGNITAAVGGTSVLNLTTTGLIITGNVTATNFTGNVANATYATTAGSATSATTAGTVTTAAQGNITSVGTLSGLTSTGTVNFGGASNVTLGSNSIVHISGGSSGQVLTTDGSGSLTWSTVNASELSNSTASMTLLADGTVDLPRGKINVDSYGNGVQLYSDPSETNITYTQINFNDVSFLYCDADGTYMNHGVNFAYTNDSGFNVLTDAAGAGYSWGFGTSGTTTLPGALQLAVYADTTARNSAIPTPAAGMMIFLTSTGKFQGYNGSAWTDLN